MLPETVARLAELPEVVAIKEASGNLAQMTDIITLAGEINRPTQSASFL